MTKGKLGRFYLLLTVLFVLSTLPSVGQMKDEGQAASKLRFAISFSPQSSQEALDGRLLLLISTDNAKEPRFQINEDPNTQQVFGVDVDGMKPGETAVIGGDVLGYPRQSIAELPAGEYWVQALIHR